MQSLQQRDFETKTQSELSQYFWKISKQSDPWKHDIEIISTTTSSGLPWHASFPHFTVQVLSSFLCWNDKAEALVAEQNVPVSHPTWWKGSWVINLSEVLNSVVSFTNWSKHWNPVLHIRPFAGKASVYSSPLPLYKLNSHLETQ